MTQLTVAYFTKEVNKRLVKLSLKYNGSLANPKESEPIEHNDYPN